MVFQTQTGKTARRSSPKWQGKSHGLGIQSERAVLPGADYQQMNLRLFFFWISKDALGVIETPYDIPLPELREDTLWFGLAVDELLKQAASPQQFVWAADWETVPAMVLARTRHHVSLTLHNTFDECLVSEIGTFGKNFKIFGTERKNEGIKTALEIGMELADVVTTVNRGFAYGMRNEAVQTKVMASHLQSAMERVVGINNAAFAKVNDSLLALKQLSDRKSGRRPERTL